MRMEREAGAGGPIITGLGPSGFRVGDSSFPALLLTIDAATPWSPPALDALDAAALAPLIAARPEFILLGTGPILVQPPRALVTALERDGLGIEAMDSRAAARAWGVLRGEGRVIAAALYPLTSPMR